MSTIGPDLPPHLLAKRKRQAADAEAILEAATPRPESHSSNLEIGAKRRRAIGPAAPPAPLDERPVQPPDPSSNGEESDSDDDYGPAPPSAAQTKSTKLDISEEEDDEASTVQSSAKRDGWMTIPPKEDGLAARMDPTRARPRKFNTGKGARVPNHGDGIDASWTETPEEKRKRLADKVLGVEDRSASSTAARSNKQEERDVDTARKIREHNEKSRGKSLYEEHHNKVGTDKDDDPGKRAFDREKDIVGGTKIGHTQRKEMLNRAAGFSSRFSGGGYL